MKTIGILSTVALSLVATSVFADTIILRDGSSHTGESSIGVVNFSDLHGVKYQFPLKDVQSLAFNSSQDTVTLRSGLSYTGHFPGTAPIRFEDSQGIKYEFPTSDIDAIVFNRLGLSPATTVTSDLVIPIGTDLPVRINETIDSADSYQGKT